MLPARSDLLWGQGGRWRAGQAAHPHCSQAGPAPSCLLRLTWAVPGPDPTRLHWPLGLMDLINDYVMNSAFMDSDSVLFEPLEENFEN